MYKIYALYALITTGSLFGTTEKTTDFSVFKNVKKVVFAFDFDKVVSFFDKSYWFRLAGNYIRSNPLKTTRVVIKPGFWRDVYNLGHARVYDAQGRAVIGAEASIDYLVTRYITWATEADKERFRGAVSAVLPNHDVIDFAVQLEVPYVIWTNNDPATYTTKLNSINTQRAQKGMALFEPASAHTSVSTGAAGSDAQNNVKPHVEYYARVYAETCAQFGLQHGELLVIFIDDSALYIDGARNAAALYGLPIKAYQYAGSMKYLVNDFRYDEEWFDIYMQTMQKQ